MRFLFGVGVMGVTLAGAVPAAHLSAVNAAAVHSFATIDVPGASFTNAFGINQSGVIVGIYQKTLTSAFHTFERSTAGTFSTIDPPNVTFAGAAGFNDAGAVVGAFDRGGSQFGFLRSPAGR